MVVVFIVLGILVLGVIVGLVSRPRYKRAQAAFGAGVRALAATTGWQFDRTPVGPLNLRFGDLSNVLGATSWDQLAVTAQLAGQWRGVPVRVLQLRYGKEQLAVKTGTSATLITMPRPVPGPIVTLTPRGFSMANFLATDQQLGYPPFDERFHVHARDVQEAQAVLTPPLAGQLAADPRMRERSLLFARDEVAAVFPGPMTQDQVTIATADLLADLTQRMAGR